MADSDTEPTTETGEMFYVDGDSTDGQMIVSEDGTPLQKTVKASEMGMSSEENPSTFLLWDSLQSFPMS